MGNEVLAAGTVAASSGGGGNSSLFIIILIALFAVFYFVMIRPQRNRQRQTQEMQRRVTPGQRVRTTAGMYGTVVAIEDDDVVLEVAPGVQARFLRRAIMDVLPGEAPVDGAPVADEDEEEAADADVEDSLDEEDLEDSLDEEDEEAEEDDVLGEDVLDEEDEDGSSAPAGDRPARNGAAPD